ncbi:MAG: DNA repair protein RadA, partial [Candidatus Puniceispirillaceae bacterium]
MARSASQYHCQSCGAVSPKWAGKCDACGGWNTLVEERIEQIPGQTKRTTAKTVELKLLSAANAEGAYKRQLTNIEEFDRVTGGGLVPGSAVLIGGDPGIGKSTLLLQLVCELGLAGQKTAYITGEESVEQVRMRALRLGLQNAEAGLAAATNAADIAETVRNTPDLDLLVIDSIQTMFVPGLNSAPGTVSQVRASAHELIRATKNSRATVIFVGHVTKDGAIAGPRVLEHMVDCVLYFEGDRSHHFRILRGVKNRFGATDEIGVFEMSETGLQQVPNPSELFLGDRQNRVAGTAVFAGLEGTRPLLVEIEALVAPSTLATPRRNVVGWDTGRLAML